MARKPQVSYWPTRGGYMTTYRGKQIVLATGPKDEMTGPTYLAALKKFREILEMGAADYRRDDNTCRVVLDLYLQHVEADLEPNTLRFRLRYLKPFAAEFGDVRCRDLTRHAVNGWLMEMRRPGGNRKGWNDGGVGAAIGVISTGFRWAVGEGLITKNPLAGLKKPRGYSRGRESLVGHSADERDRNYALILGAATKQFRPFVKVLKATGARPSEIAAATAANFDADMGAIRYFADERRREGEHRHKNARHKDRVIVLVGEALEIVRDLAARHLTGPLFRTAMGKPWNSKEIILRFLRIREKTGLKVTAYSLRHQFCTDWLKAGKSVDMLATLLGNSPEVIRLHYAHLLGDTANLRRQMEEFSQGNVSRPRLVDGGASSASAVPESA